MPLVRAHGHSGRSLPLHAGSPPGGGCAPFAGFWGPALRRLGRSRSRPFSNFLLGKPKAEGIDPGFCIDPDCEQRSAGAGPGPPGDVCSRPTQFGV